LGGRVCSLRPYFVILYQLYAAWSIWHTESRYTADFCAATGGGIWALRGSCHCVPLSLEGNRWAPLLRCGHVRVSDFGTLASNAANSRLLGLLPPQRLAVCEHLRYDGTSCLLTASLRGRSEKMKSHHHSLGCCGDDCSLVAWWDFFSGPDSCYFVSYSGIGKVTAKGGANEFRGKKPTKTQQKKHNRLYWVIACMKQSRDPLTDAVFVVKAGILGLRPVSTGATFRVPY